jgi:8-oxo-dGTP diphosphatase
MKKIDVTCAVISFNDKILVVQRSENMKLPLKWEFPGGKMELGESDEDCIVREIKEELNIEIELLSRLQPTNYIYPNMSIQLIPFLARFRSGIIKLSEHKQYQLLTNEKLKELDWAEADLPILNEYLNL